MNQSLTLNQLANNVMNTPINPSHVAHFVSSLIIGVVIGITCIFLVVFGAFLIIKHLMFKDFRKNNWR